MTVINPPGFLQNAGATHTAEQFRNWTGSLTAGFIAATPLIPRGGVNINLGNALQVTQAGSPNMTVLVKSGVAAIPGSEGSKQGIYSVLNDADVTVTITTAHVSLGRIDSIVFKVQDTAYSGAVNSSSIVAVAGTPSGSPAAPTLPANCIELARVTVGAGVVSIVNGNIADRRYYLAGAGGVIPCLSTLQPPTTTVKFGQPIYEMDTLLFKIFDGSAYRRVVAENLTGGSPIEVYDTTSITSITSAVGIPGSPVCGTAFTMPASGKVYITLSGAIENTTAARYICLTWELRTGGSVGSGTIVTIGASPLFDHSLVIGRGGSPSTLLNSSKRNLVTGTPGSTYNVQTLHFVETSGSGNVGFRALLVEPVLI